MRKFTFGATKQTKVKHLMGTWLRTYLVHHFFMSKSRPFLLDHTLLDDDYPKALDISDVVILFDQTHN